MIKIDQNNNLLLLSFPEMYCRSGPRGKVPKTLAAFPRRTPNGQTDPLREETGSPWIPCHSQVY